MNQSTSVKGTTGAVINEWLPEDPQFWQERGQHIARRNLWISVPCLLLSFCVWMLFSIVAVNLNKVGFHFTTDQLFLLTALPSISGAILRVPYSFMVPLFGGRRWTVFCTGILIIPCAWLGIAVQNPATSFTSFMIISLLCGVAGANFASSMANISLFYPKHQQGTALGINGGLGNLGVSVMQLLAPITILFAMFTFLGGKGVILEDGSHLYLENTAWIWIPFLVIFTLAAWFGMNDLESAKMSLGRQLKILGRGHLWIMSLLYLATFGSFIGFSAGFAVLAKTQFPQISILHFAFLGPLVGALARPFGGAISDRLGGSKVTLVNFLIMGVFSALLLFTLPNAGSQGSFTAFFIIFLVLFLTSGFGSGSTFQLIASLFRKMTIDQLIARGASESQAIREAATDTAGALGFISAIGAVGGFFIPKAFGTSLQLTGSPVGAMKIFMIFYFVCMIITWLAYSRKTSKTGS